ncbi:MAG: HupE/UreJ family protein [Colwellia sp.]|nr:HupE/UreJ family protein [Colwellia sp.]MCW8863896.1 HupE/UreJ family protein [Colwellia sp.]MCW9081178.1 HupE/UreJ family protein [Colwellia sp.]
MNKVAAVFWPTLFSIALWLNPLFFSACFSHALEPGYLEIKAQYDDVYTITWKVPQVGGLPMNISALLPENCQYRHAPNLSFTGNAFSTNWTTNCAGGVGGQEVFIEGLNSTATDVLVRVQSISGEVATLLLTPEYPNKILPISPSIWDVITTYLVLGIDHILVGIDHLLFVLALIILVSSKWKLFKTITAFTLAHSITLSAASLGYITIYTPVVEAIIALSIVFLAVEILKRRTGELRLSERKPWLVAFLFGLLHGLGFASALSETGLPKNEIPTALLTFNIGVEIGQLIFISVILILVKASDIICQYSNIGSIARRLSLHSVVYLIGGISAYWLIERIAGFWLVT